MTSEQHQTAADSLRPAIRRMRQSAAALVALGVLIMVFRVFGGALHLVYGACAIVCGLMVFWTADNMRRRARRADGSDHSEVS